MSIHIIIIVLRNIVVFAYYNEQVAFKYSTVWSIIILSHFFFVISYLIFTVHILVVCILYAKKKKDKKKY